MTNIPIPPAIPPYRFSIETAKNGDAIAVIEIEGSKFYAGSRYDPAKEAARFAALIAPEDGDLIVLLSGGVPAVQALLNIPKKFRLAYIEPFRELADGIRIRDTRLVRFSEPSALLDAIRNITVDNLLRFRFVVPPSMKTPLADYAAWLSKAANAQFQLRVSEIMTLAAIGEEVVSNLVANLRHFSRLHPVRHLFAAGAGQGGHCAVAASGPSLDLAMPQIARYRDRLRLICVDSAVAPLLANDIVPDLAVCLDPRKDLLEHIEPIPPDGRRRVVWVVAATVHPDVLRLLKDSRVFVFVTDHPLEKWLAERFGDPGDLAGGGSVILPAFDLACRMGARDVILAGADFSFGEGSISHSRGSAKFKKSLLASSRFDTVETRTRAEAVEKAPRRVSFKQEMFRTGENLLAYRAQLERRVRDFGGRCRQIFPKLGLEGVEAQNSLRDLEKTPIIENRGFLSDEFRPWATVQQLDTAYADIRRRLTVGIHDDPLFQTSVEAAVFRKARGSRRPAGDILPEVAQEQAARLKKVLDEDSEDR